MKHAYLLFMCLAFLFFNCTDTPVNSLQSKEETIFPFKIKLEGVLREIEEVQNSCPPITMVINRDTIRITVGKTEHYTYPYQQSDFDKVLQYFKPSDFQSNNYYFNPYLPYGRIIEIEKSIEGRTYKKIISGYKRRDIDEKYLELDSVEIFKTYHLSKIANEIAIPFIKDTINKADMITAKSMKEALLNPERVYELTLRNTRTNYLSPNIKKLTNLRILDISGSFIKTIPPEIEQCKYLKSILANASRLENIPSTIGNLKQLRVLNLAACKIKTIPSEMGDINSLWSLSLASNQLKTVPESLAKLKNVTFFSIADNNLTHFPIPLLGLESAYNFWIHDNDFNTLPKEIVQLKSLQRLLIDVDDIENMDTIRLLIPEVFIIDE